MLCETIHADFPTTLFNIWLGILKKKMQKKKSFCKQARKTKTQSHRQQHGGY